jgi:hypothetical protein
MADKLKNPMMTAKTFEAARDAMIEAGMSGLTVDQNSVMGIDKEVWDRKVFGSMLIKEDFWGSDTYVTEDDWRIGSLCVTECIE